MIVEIFQPRETRLASGRVVTYIYDSYGGLEQGQAMFKKITDPNQDEDDHVNPRTEARTPHRSLTRPLVEVATILFRVATFCELFGVLSGAVEVYLVRVAFAECFIPIHWSIIATAVRLEPLSKIDFIVIWLE